MAKFQLLSCDIALAGDILNVVARHEYIPITYPELLVLQYIHGENAITSIYQVGFVEREPAAEMARLCDTYSTNLIRERLFPGAAMRLPLGEERYRPRISAPPDAAPAVPDVPTDPWEGRVPATPGVEYQDTSGTTPATRTSRLPGPDALPERMHDKDPPAVPTPSTRSAVSPRRDVPVDRA